MEKIVICRMSHSENTIPRFVVNEVPLGPKIPNIARGEVKNAWGRIGSLLDCSQVNDDVPVVEFFTSPNLLAASVYKAFYHHYPLKINPNAIWLTICQGFAKYINLNAEALRSRFVSFSGKKELVVECPHFPRNDEWEGIFPEFVKQISGFVGEKTTELLDCNFSNSTPLDKAAAHITVMDIMKHYFEYTCCIFCGIPYIELLGKVEDWVLIRQKAETLRAYENPKDKVLAEWLDELLPVLDHFVAAAQGKPDIAFWGAVCNVFNMHGSGFLQKGATITGWIQVFFPYEGSDRSNSERRNHLVKSWRVAYDLAKKIGVKKAMECAQSSSDENTVRGMKLEDIPSGLSRAPVKITGEGSEDINVLFYAGLVSMHQHEDGALEVRPGWGVVLDEKNTKKKEREGK